MIETITVKAACNGILRTLYPDLKIYGPDTTEGLERPSFYTEIVPYYLTYETTDRVHQRVGFKISLMEDAADEEYELTMFAAIRQAFGLKALIGDRYITVSEIEYEYTGGNNDIFQITVTLDWYDTITVADDHETIEDVDVDTSLTIL